jgi:L-malate glycosyltransferase
MRKQKIIAVHLLNDFSGSPMVLRQSLEVLSKVYPVTLYSATPSGAGFLSNLTDVKQVPLKYSHSRFKILTLLYFIVFQCNLFFKLLFSVNSNDTVYINTLLPFGAALAAKCKNARVVYHVHEVSLKPALLKSFLTFVAEHTAEKILFVSVYVYSCYTFKKPSTEIIYNALPKSFVERTGQLSVFNMRTPFTILMLCSLKAYKGVNEFVSLSRRKPRFHFNLVLNATSEEVLQFCKNISPPDNCKVYAAQKDCFPFYKDAHMVLNLSHTNQWIETFGLTILEAMACRIPVIVPPVGGVCELVDDGIEGFCIDSRNEAQLIGAIDYLSSDIHVYRKFSKSAGEKARRFAIENFNENILTAFRFDETSILPEIEEISGNGKERIQQKF